MDSGKLEEKLKLLSEKVVALKHLRDEVAKSGGRGMEEWFKKVDEVSLLELDEMQKELNEIKGRGQITTFNARRHLKNKLQKRINVVRDLEKEGKSSTEVIHASLKEVTKKYPRPFSHADLMLQKKIPVMTPPNPFPSWLLTNSSMLSSLDEIPEGTDGSSHEEGFREREEDSIIHEEIEATEQKSTSSVHFDEARESEKILESFDKKCPLGGESSVILYTTRMRGVRKTFEECNNVRRILESHGIVMIERDLFTEWDEVYKQQLKNLLGRVQIPALFVKGRFIGGAKEVSSLNEEGKLDILLYGIPKATG
ncbi:Glutaredoxin family protein [Thalictrum thalictroides]|uniref:Glutaredoxin family protein n=1 Tax=Thalictrum thalictroides TaxID=46969 RepID=A0A7J6X0J6_THATH|nr:Glutaredoxin family protein [Thalictrum thalictroides]